MEDYPLMAQNMHDLVRHVFVLFTENLVAALNNENFCSQAAEGLGHLDGNGAGPENDHGFWQSFERKDFLVGDVRRLIQALDRGNGG